MCEMCSKNYDNIMQGMNNSRVQSIQQQMPDYQGSGNSYNMNGSYQ